MWLFVPFLLVPLIEIALFVQVGGAIGLWPTLAIVVATAFLGTWLVRSQGLMALNDLRKAFNDLRDPTEPLAHGAMILLAGALLLTPGFFTDACGVALLLPPVRRAVLGYVRKRVSVAQFAYGQRPQARPAPQGRADVIEGEYTEAPPPEAPARPTHRPSGWTRH